MGLPVCVAVMEGVANRERVEGVCCARSDDGKYCAEKEQNLRAQLVSLLNLLLVIHALGHED